MTRDEAREAGCTVCPTRSSGARHQAEATPEQLAAFETRASVRPERRPITLRSEQAGDTMAIQGECPKCGKRVLHVNVEIIVGMVDGDSKARCPQPQLHPFATRCWACRSTRAPNRVRAAKTAAKTASSLSCRPAAAPRLRWLRLAAGNAARRQPTTQFTRNPGGGGAAFGTGG